MMRYCLVMPNMLETCSLHARVAHALGWTEVEATRFSLPTLRDLVRPVSAKLAHEITLAMSDAVTR